jgi:hypothetical protein
VLMNSLCARIHRKMLFTTVIRRRQATDGADDGRVTAVDGHRVETIPLEDER